MRWVNRRKKREREIGSKAEKWDIRFGIHSFILLCAIFIFLLFLNFSHFWHFLNISFLSVSLRRIRIQPDWYLHMRVCVCLFYLQLVFIMIRIFKNRCVCMCMHLLQNSIDLKSIGNYISTLCVNFLIFRKSIGDERILQHQSVELLSLIFFSSAYTEYFHLLLFSNAFLWIFSPSSVIPGSKGRS